MRRSRVVGPRHPAGVVVLGLLTFASMLITAGPARADCGTPAGQIFWGAENSQGQLQSSATGQRQEIRWTPRDTDPDCPTSFVAITTAHLSIDTATGDYIEVGWQLCCNDGQDNVTFVWFAEYGVNFEIPAGGFVWGYDIPCDHANNSFDQWKIQENPLGSHDWDLGIYCLTEQGGHNLHWWYNKFGSDSTGIPRTETERKSDSQTGMSDFHQALEFRGTGGGWNAWYALACISDSASNWNGRSRTSPLRFDVISSGGINC